MKNFLALIGAIVLVVFMALSFTRGVGTVHRNQCLAGAVQYGGYEVEFKMLGTYIHMTCTYTFGIAHYKAYYWNSSGGRWIQSVDEQFFYP